MATIICLVRHGQTAWNKEGRVQGRSNIPLNENGIEQAKQVSKYLLDNDPNWDIILSSPLDRAYETARIIKNSLKYSNDIIMMNSLLERNFGDAEAEIMNPYVVDLIMDDFFFNLETKEEVSIRAYNALLEISKLYPDKKVLVCTHSHFIKGALYAIDKTFSFKTWLKNLSLNYFVINDDIITLDKFNI